MSALLTWEQSELLRLRYVCSDCWSPIFFKKSEQVPDMYQTLCGTPGCTTPGIVSIRSMHYRQGENEHFYRLAIQALRDALPWLHKEKDNLAPEKILKLLGY